MTEPIGRRFVISGIVQGVGYRAFARRTAAALGLRGFVRNLPDGTVEAVVAGAASAVMVLEAELRRGTAHGTVTQLLASEVDPQVISSKAFEIN